MVVDDDDVVVHRDLLASIPIVVPVCGGGSGGLFSCCLRSVDVKIDCVLLVIDFVLFGFHLCCPPPIITPVPLFNVELYDDDDEIIDLCMASDGANVAVLRLTTIGPCPILPNFSFNPATV